MHNKLLINLAAVCALALAAAPVAAAKGGHGNACGKGHAKHAKQLGHSCAKTHGKRDAAAPAAPIHVSAGVVKACQDERAADAQAFTDKYGDANGREALGRCIKQHAADSTDTTDSTDSTDSHGSADGHPHGDGPSGPAKVCLAEMKADSAAFKAKYDPNGHEPFGRCVSQHAQAQGSSPGAGDEGDQGDDENGDAEDGPDGPDSPGDGDLGDD
jgi:hypothetical protein